VSAFDDMSRMDPADVCASVRLRVNPCAAAMLDWLARNFGPLALVVGADEADGGRVGWQRAPDFVPEADEIAWGVLDWGTLYVRVESGAPPANRQLVLDMAFGGDPLDGLFKEFRLVGVWRPYSDGDRELLRYAAKLEAWSAIRHAARRP